MPNHDVLSLTPSQVDAAYTQASSALVVPSRTHMLVDTWAGMALVSQERAGLAGDSVEVGYTQLMLLTGHEATHLDDGAMVEKVLARLASTAGGYSLEQEGEWMGLPEKPNDREQLAVRLRAQGAKIGVGELASALAFCAIRADEDGRPDDFMTNLGRLTVLVSPKLDVRHFETPSAKALVTELRGVRDHLSDKEDLDEYGGDPHRHAAVFQAVWSMASGKQLGDPRMIIGRYVDASREAIAAAAQARAEAEEQGASEEEAKQAGREADLAIKVGGIPEAKAIEPQASAPRLDEKEVTGQFKLQRQGGAPIVVKTPPPLAPSDSQPPAEQRALPPAPADLPLPDREMPLYESMGVAAAIHNGSENPDPELYYQFRQRLKNQGNDRALLQEFADACGVELTEGEDGHLVVIGEGADRLHRRRLERDGSVLSSVAAAEALTMTNDDSEPVKQTPFDSDIQLVPEGRHRIKDTLSWLGDRLLRRSKNK